MNPPEKKKVLKQNRIIGGGVSLHLECGHIIRPHEDPGFPVAISYCTECDKIEADER